MPSAMVSAGGMVTSRPASRARSAAGSTLLSTPTMRTSGRVSLMAVAMPEMMPPPAHPAHHHVHLRHCSISSSPMVPCPAIMAGSSKGWMSVCPSRAWMRSASAMASSYTEPCSTTVAP